MFVLLFVSEHILSASLEERQNWNVCIMKSSSEKGENSFIMMSFLPRVVYLAFGVWKWLNLSRFLFQVFTVKQESCLVSALYGHIL